MPPAMVLWVNCQSPRTASHLAFMGNCCLYLTWDRLACLTPVGKIYFWNCFLGPHPISFGAFISEKICCLLLQSMQAKADNGERQVAEDNHGCQLPKRNEATAVKTLTLLRACRVNRKSVQDSESLRPWTSRQGRENSSEVFIVLTLRRCLGSMKELFNQMTILTQQNRRRCINTLITTVESAHPPCMEMQGKSM